MRALLPCSLLAAFLLAGCSGGELVGIHLMLNKDGTGLVTTRALVEPGAGTAEAQAQGVAWKTHAGVTCAQGTFQHIKDLKLGDGGIWFDPDLGDARPNVRVKIARGPTAAWVKSLVPEQAKTRRDMAKVYDPTGRTNEIGDILRIEVSVPGEVFASGVRPVGRGVEAAHEGKRAYLLIPVRTALEAGDPFEWSFSW